MLGFLNGRQPEENSDTETQPVETSAESEQAEVSATQSKPAETTASASQTTTTTATTKVSVEAEVKEEAKGFVHADGNRIIGTDGEELLIKGIALGNTVWSNPGTPNTKHHTEETYKELSEMGFNSVRFYLNYNLFESDSEPYKYKDIGFDWIDTNIAWAKKYNMGIILNMHFPQGGYQSNGGGLALWTDPENQNRLTALWKEIAARYADEPAIWGYGIVNEPVLPALGTQEETARLYFDLAGRITREIRSVSPYQAVFVEKICNYKSADNSSIDWEWYDIDKTFSIIPDDNVIYEFHTYEPMAFTHQDTSWTDYNGLYQTYPSNEIGSANYESYWVDCIVADRNGSEGEWEYFVSETGSGTSQYNVVAVALNGRYTAEGTAYFDDITLTEIAPDGKETVIASYDFNNGSLGSFYPWSSDGTGGQSYSYDGRSGGCLKITGAVNDFTTTATRYEMKDGYRYRVSGYIRKETSSSYPAIRMDFAKATDIKAMNKTYLETVIKNYADFGKRNNVPVYMGEFGVARAGFENERGATQWVSDMLDLCYEYGVSFNYHTYHEESFGLYRSKDTVLPDRKDINAELAQLFREKIK
ncbi:MAG: cellulase family glycosylhydrolase [Ruminiclostridium sp.]|nr:cellulase family glycosylhydrolase [Ruminiclostridium sp.]